MSGLTNKLVRAIGVTCRHTASAVSCPPAIGPRAGQNNRAVPAWHLFSLTHTGTHAHAYGGIRPAGGAAHRAPHVAADIAQAADALRDSAAWLNRCAAGRRLVRLQAQPEAEISRKAFFYYNCNFDDTVPRRTIGEEQPQ